ncbi:hypothetical protein SO694_00004265 [Aureococcus anophagefferens]|uniref:TPL/SMU1 LisH-like dimerisation domain-containing protein n=1 Tax=Aureococcus anophagefferens TaxID=44056 RepID=A0ABR1G944_AURAN
MATAQASSDGAAMAAPPLIASDIGIGSVEIDASDVVRLVLQFLKEHGLSSSAAELERESGVLVNAVEAKGRLVGDVRSGSSGEASDAVVSGSADGTVRVWDPRSAETVSTFSPPKALAGFERRARRGQGAPAVVAVLQQPGSESKFFVVDKSPTAVLADLRTGVAVAAFSSRDEPARPPSRRAARSGSPAATSSRRR